MTSSPEEVNRYTIAVRDFEKAREFTRAAHGHKTNTIEHEALLFSAIVSYVRPFSPNEKSDNAKAISRLYMGQFDSLTDDQVKFHARLCDLRNKALAHSEFAFNPTSFDSETGVFSSRTFSILNEQIDLEFFEALLEQVIQTCHRRRADYAHVAVAKGK